MGVAAMERLMAGESGVMVGLDGRVIAPVPIEEVTTKTRGIGEEYYKMAYTLSR
jgi:6-phosphofructokinase